ncbi:hypothetical protein [Desulfobacter postgatei]|nr:hypothetical protein [Desulfobacter postgatei]MDX9963959.1 hypothetical protein [Desulfobacter postgatei]
MVELADTQRDELEQIVALTGVSEDSLAQTIFDWGFEPMSDMARMIKAR